jgi:hypothetical protein
MALAKENHALKKLTVTYKSNFYLRQTCVASNTVFALVVYYVMRHNLLGE